MKILHLYHDIMNLYGEYGNISALTRMLEKSGIAYELEKKTVSDTLTIKDCDFIYVGSGTESNQKYVLEHLKQYREELREFIEAGKVLLMTGNSFELCGKTITDAKGKEYVGLGLFDFLTIEQEKTRTTADAVFTMEGLEQPVVGFINKCSQLYGIETPLFSVEMGLGNENTGKTEGIRYQNFFGTHMTGPILVKNPYFLGYVAGILTAGEGKSLAEDYLTYERKGYEVTLRELRKRQQQ